jgi:hypothetical protein
VSAASTHFMCGRSPHRLVRCLSHRKECVRVRVHVCSRIIKDEGVLALWKGTTPTAVRAIALNVGMLAFSTWLVLRCNHHLACLV